ncbi:MAG: branched-chain amino acid transaminase [Deltaproteobacteria bacterium]|nr:branched-chain amino acid transaminase [Deltaproteobacteria bacterium]
MSVRSDFIWFDGDFVPYDDATVHVLSHTLHYGLGVFEGIRAYEQPDGTAGIWRLEPHLKRFLDSLKMMRWECGYTHDQLRDACLSTLQRNGFTSAYLRPIAFLGHGEMGLGARGNKLHTVVASWKWGAYLGAEGMERGVRLQTSSFTRHHPNAALQRAKVVGHYVNSILARYEANENGFDEALMLDGHGMVAEGTGENVFVVHDGVVSTPMVTNILPGITRDSVMDICKHEGIEVRETTFGRDAFYTADEAFMCGSAAEVTPVRELDRRQIGSGSRGPITERIQSIYLDAVRGRVDWMKDDITTA